MGVSKAKIALQREVFRSLRENEGHIGEADDAVNDASRAVIAAVAAQHGEAWLGQFNLYGSDRGRRERALWRWDGENPVVNFGADFVLPKQDEEVMRLILERDSAPYTGVAADRKWLDAIIARVEGLGGILLTWS